MALLSHRVLVLNPGSATLKFGLYQMPGATVLASGLVDRMGTPQSELKMLVAGQKPEVNPVEARGPGPAADQIIQRLLSLPGGNAHAPARIDAVACRVVHGGPGLVKPTLVTASVLDALRALKEMAPLHIPGDVAVLEQVQQSLPGLPVIAVFDTAFHQTLPEVARTYALPVELCARYGLRRYGFHGISHAYVSRQLIKHLGRGAKGTKVITCHLGNGASVCAVRDGKSIDTSMGFTPMEGLVMGTRSGDVDPGLLVYLIRAAGMTAAEVDDLLNQRSGLFGLSGRSADLRDLERAALKKDRRAELALEVFAYRACKYIGAFAAALQGLDAIAFTGGMGEHSASMRGRICRRLGFLGLRLDGRRNRAASGRGARQIGIEDGGVQTWVIPTDEEGEIATSTVEQVRALARRAAKPPVATAFVRTRKSKPRKG